MSRGVSPRARNSRVPQAASTVSMGRAHTSVWFSWRARCACSSWALVCSRACVNLSFSVCNSAELAFSALT